MRVGKQCSAQDLVSKWCYRTRCTVEVPKKWWLWRKFGIMQRKRHKIELKISLSEFYVRRTNKMSDCLNECMKEIS